MNDANRDSTDNHSVDGLSADATGSADAEKSSPPRWQSSELLRGQREALILHAGQTYRLICTRNGKLILQK